jgi:hypothetical protein
MIPLLFFCVGLLLGACYRDHQMAKLQADLEWQSWLAHSRGLRLAKRERVLLSFSRN